MKQSAGVISALSLTEVAVAVRVDGVFVWAVEGVGGQVVHLDGPGPIVRARGSDHHQVLEAKKQ